MKIITRTIPVMMAGILLFFARCESEQYPNNFEDIYKAGPAIDAFLAGLDQTMDDAQKMDALTTWLQSHACIDDAYIACVSCIETNPTQSEIVVSFTESGVKKQLTLDILMSNPPAFAGFHDAPPPAEVKDLCSCIPEDLNKAGPAIDAFLAGLDQTMDDAQKMDALTTWLQSHACIDDAYIACVSCIETNPTQSEIVVSFTESGVKKQLTLDILMSNPPAFAGFHDAPPPAEVKDLCSCIHTEDLNKAGPVIDAFLAGLDQAMDDAQKMDALAAWLQSHACIDDAYIACVSCIKTNPAQSEIVISFTESGVKKQLTLDILMSNPPRFSATH